MGAEVRKLQKKTTSFTPLSSSGGASVACPRLQEDEDISQTRRLRL